MGNNSRKSSPSSWAYLGTIIKSAEGSSYEEIKDLIVYGRHGKARADMENQQQFHATKIKLFESLARTGHAVDIERRICMHLRSLKIWQAPNKYTIT